MPGPGSGYDRYLLWPLSLPPLLRHEQLVSAAHSSGHTVLFTGEKCICCALVGLM
jgi:hypothetical protein